MKCEKCGMTLDDKKIDDMLAEYLDGRLDFIGDLSRETAEAFASALRNTKVILDSPIDGRGDTCCHEHCAIERVVEE